MSAFLIKKEFNIDIDVGVVSLQSANGPPFLFFPPPSLVDIYRFFFLLGDVLEADVLNGLLFLFIEDPLLGEEFLLGEFPLFGLKVPLIGEFYSMK